jgi:hypothetical protein
MRELVMGMRKDELGAEGCLGTLAFLVYAPIGYSLWQSVGPWAAIVPGLVIVGIAGFLGEKINKHFEFQRILKQEREKIRLTELRRRARTEIIKNSDLSKSGQRQRRIIPEHILEAVFERDGGQCVLCGATEELQFDHILHHSKGGADTVENLRLLCRTCNQRRGGHFR